MHTLILEEGKLYISSHSSTKETVLEGVSVGRIREVELVTLADHPGCLLVGDTDRYLQRPVQSSLWFLSQGREIVHKKYLSFSVD